MNWGPSETEAKALKELIVAIIAAGISAYVRATREPDPWTLRMLCARLAEAVVCGFISIGASSVMEWTDPRTSVGVAAGLGLVGTAYIRDLLVRWLGKRAEKT